MNSAEMAVKLPRIIGYLKEVIRISDDASLRGGAADLIVELCVSGQPVAAGLTELSEDGQTAAKLIGLSKIASIKKLRELRDMSLKNAKDYVELLEAKGLWRHPPV